MEQLKNRDYKLVIDQSGSMTETDVNGGKSRWHAVQESTLAIARQVSEYDPDGIDVYTFNSKFKSYPNTTPDKVAGIFKEQQPMGSTILAPVLKSIFDDYTARKARKETKANGEMLLVVTDGEPQDEQAVAREIVEFTKHLDNGDGEYGISFIQVGKDAGAAAFLKRLDDSLTTEGAKFDIVDTVTFDEMEERPLSDVLMSALTD